MDGPGFIRLVSPEGNEELVNEKLLSIATLGNCNTLQVSRYEPGLRPKIH